jgi:hypothetical protein
MHLSYRTVRSLVALALRMCHAVQSKANRSRFRCTWILGGLVVAYLHKAPALRVGNLLLDVRHTLIWLLPAYSTSHLRVDSAEVVEK